MAFGECAFQLQLLSKPAFVLGTLQYLAGYYHIYDGYLVDTKNK